MSALVLENVTRSFGGVHAVSDVSLRAPRGSITGLIGPNGAGKTTLINLITGTLGLSSGRITLDDADLGAQEPDIVARRGVSRTFQNIRLLPEASVLENVMIGFHRHERVSILAGLLGLPASRRETAQILEKSMALLERFHIKRFASMPAGALSYGHQRRVEMARAVASDPAILLLDEPVAGMNDVEANELGDIFEELARGNMGLILIEHNIRFVTRMAKHVYVLASGRLICEGSPQAVMHDEKVVVAYLGKK
ncbi:MAG: ABC transporter ATP-binding protein [Burkholderiaceae bacterium]|nr:ABC transporter ATP-binding protein [Burkholderiaceae bacterium]